MGRNVVLCFDGTKNEYTATTDTNVVKLYAMLDRSRSDQLAYYQPGIGTYLPPGAWGTIRRWIVTRLDLAMAWLLEHHVTDAYWPVFAAKPWACSVNQIEWRAHGFERSRLGYLLNGIGMFDLNKKLWTVPANRMKAAREHRVHAPVQTRKRRALGVAN